MSGDAQGILVVEVASWPDIYGPWCADQARQTGGVASGVSFLPQVGIADHWFTKPAQCHRAARTSLNPDGRLRCQQHGRGGEHDEVIRLSGVEL
jgi:hypothetical protein